MKRTLLIIYLLLLLSGCLCCGGDSTGGSGSLLGKSDEDKAVDDADKAFDEAVNAVKGVKGQFDPSSVSRYYSIGDEITVTFITRDYTGSQDISHAIVGQGRASYRVEKKGAYDKLMLEEAGANREFIVYTISLKGDAGNKGHPLSFDETGSDPSPTFYLVDGDGKMYYSSGWDNGKAVSQKNKEYPTQGPVVGYTLKNFESMGRYKMNMTEWKKTAIAFKVDKGLQDLTLILKTKTGDNQYNYVGIG